MLQSPVWPPWEIGLSQVSRNKYIQYYYLVISLNINIFNIRICWKKFRKIFILCQVCDKLAKNLLFWGRVVIKNLHCMYSIFIFVQIALNIERIYSLCRVKKGASTAGAGTLEEPTEGDWGTILEWIYAFNFASWDYGSMRQLNRLEWWGNSYRNSLNSQWGSINKWGRI